MFSKTVFTKNLKALLSYSKVKQIIGAHTCKRLANPQQQIAVSIMNENHPLFVAIREYSREVTREQDRRST